MKTYWILNEYLRPRLQEAESEANAFIQSAQKMAAAKVCGFNGDLDKALQYQAAFNYRVIADEAIPQKYKNEFGEVEWGTLVQDLKIEPFKA